MEYFTRVLVFNQVILRIFTIIINITRNCTRTAIVVSGKRKLKVPNLKKIINVILA